MIGPGSRERQGGAGTRSAFSLTQLDWEQRQILVGVVRIQRDQPWADGLMQRSLFGWCGDTDPLGGDYLTAGLAILRVECVWSSDAIKIL